METLAKTRTSLVAELRRAGWKIAKDAMDPLQQVNFAKLVAILDHEEHFLERTFMSALTSLPTARVGVKARERKITAADVETALRMVGVAAQRQPEATLSKASLGAIKDSCGFCK